MPINTVLANIRNLEAADKHLHRQLAGVTDADIKAELQESLAEVSASIAHFRGIARRAGF